MSQANQFSQSILAVGTSQIMQYGVDFGFDAHTIELYHDSTGLSVGFSLNSSVASTNGPYAFQSEKRTFTDVSVRKLGLCTLSTTTSTAAAGAAPLRVNAWG